MPNNLDPQYQNLVKDIIQNGYSKEDRTKTGTKSLFGKQIRHKISEGFPLLTTKKMPFKTIVTELLWFLRGDTNIKFLVDNNCHIWDGDCYKAYKTSIREMIESWDAKYHEVLKNEANGNRPFTQEEFINKIKTDDKFAKKWGELGPIYGKQWRSWEGVGFHGEETVSSYTDQFFNIINDLKNNPDSRRIIVSAWNVGEMKDMVLPPCHNFFQFYTRELTTEEKYAPYPELLKIYQDKINNIKLFKYEDAARNRQEEKDILKTLPELPTRAISLMWNQHSVDTGLGLPFNIASYALLLELVGKMVNMVPDELIGNLGDVHLYNNHIYPIQEQLDREPFELPKLKFSDWLSNSIYEKQPEIVFNDWIESLKLEDFSLENYISHERIELPLSN